MDAHTELNLSGAVSLKASSPLAGCGPPSSGFSLDITSRAGRLSQHSRGETG